MNRLHSQIVNELYVQPRNKNLRKSSTSFPMVFYDASRFYQYTVYRMEKRLDDIDFHTEKTYRRKTGLFRNKTHFIIRSKNETSFT